MLRSGSGTVRLGQEMNIRVRSRALEAEFFDFVVVVLAVEDVPFLGAFEDYLALGGDFLTGGGVDAGFFGEEFFEGFAGFLADGVAVFAEVDFGEFGEGVGDGVGELVELVAGDPHRTALYWATSFCLIFLNISG